MSMAIDLDLWIYRRNVGWWLEAEHYDDYTDAAAGAEELRRENSTPHDAFAFAVVPHGTFAALWGAVFAAKAVKMA